MDDVYGISYTLYWYQLAHIEFFNYTFLLEPVNTELRLTVLNFLRIFSFSIVLNL